MKLCEGNPTKHECHISPKGCEYCEHYLWKSVTVDIREFNKDSLEEALKAVTEMVIEEHGKLSS